MHHYILAHDPQTGESIGVTIGDNTADVMRCRAAAHDLSRYELIEVIGDLLELIPRPHA